MTQTIHQVAYNCRGAVKPADAERIILELHERYPHETEALGKLLALHGPKLTGKPKTAFAWVALAAAIVDDRNYLRMVYVNDGTMVCTDGHRLHAAPTDLGPGYYDPKTGQRLFGLDTSEPGHPGAFPNWRRNVARLVDCTPVNTEPTGDTVGKTKAVRVAHLAVNEKYYREAAHRCGELYADPFTDKFIDGRVQMRGENGELAVIMPLWEDRK